MAQGGTASRRIRERNSKNAVWLQPETAARADGVCRSQSLFQVIWPTYLLPNTERPRAILDNEPLQMRQNVRLRIAALNPKPRRCTHAAHPRACCLSKASPRDFWGGDLVVARLPGPLFPSPRSGRRFSRRASPHPASIARARCRSGAGRRCGPQWPPQHVGGGGSRRGWEGDVKNAITHPLHHATLAHLAPHLPCLSSLSSLAETKRPTTLLNHA